MDEHSLHSPFLFDFYQHVIKPATDSGAAPETIRRALLKNREVIEVNDLGSRGHQTGRRLGDIARTSLSPAKYAQRYERAIRYLGCQDILELGTSLGINTLYLSAAAHAEVITIEGAPAVARVAEKNFADVGRTNIRLLVGNIDDLLPPLLATRDKIDFAFVDANHRYAPTRSYVDQLIPKMHERSLLVLDDIHYSRGMEKAWNEVRRLPAITGSFDLFRCGMLFFAPQLNNQHVVLQG